MGSGAALGAGFDRNESGTITFDPQNGQLIVALFPSVVNGAPQSGHENVSPAVINTHP
jgi:hypothetical protein